jgi:hypothetical protein
MLGGEEDKQEKEYCVTVQVYFILYIYINPSKIYKCAFHNGDEV